MKNNSDQKTTYIVTGASGHLGNVLVRKLLKRGEQVTGLLLPGEKPPACGMRTVYGNVCEKESLRPLFLSGTEAVVIHCAGCVSISSYDGLKLWNTNVLGTRNLVELAEEYNVAKFIYVSSVHALPEREKGQQITEIQDFDDTLVVGDYAKTKALATRCVLQEAASGFPACTVHPSGLIGPYDPGAGQMTRLLKLFLKGLLPAAVAGGYDFADVRDVADGILPAVSVENRERAISCPATIIPSGNFWILRPKRRTGHPFPSACRGMSPQPSPTFPNASPTVWEKAPFSHRIPSIPWAQTPTFPIKRQATAWVITPGAGRKRSGIWSAGPFADSEPFKIM